MAPWLWIVEGPNGAGKSSFAGKFLDALPAAYPQYRLPVTIVPLNADERTLALRQKFPDAAQDALNLRAAQEIDAELARLIEAGKSVVVETVLSSPKYRDDVETAKAKGQGIRISNVLDERLSACPARRESIRHPVRFTRATRWKSASRWGRFSLQCSLGKELMTNYIRDKAVMFLDNGSYIPIRIREKAESAGRAPIFLPFDKIAHDARVCVG